VGHLNVVDSISGSESRVVSAVTDKQHQHAWLRLVVGFAARPWGAGLLLYLRTLFLHLLLIGASVLWLRRLITLERPCRSCCLVLDERTADAVVLADLGECLREGGGGRVVRA
jgi:hypothetical protein